jgi:signal transduction histidine kinase
MVTNLALVLVALAVGDARRGRLALARAAAEEEEREREAAAQHHFDERRLRLAHELHDTVAHALVAINVRAAAAAHLQRNAPGESFTALEEIKRTSADALADLRSTLRTLRSASDEAPLRPAQSLANLPDLVDGLAGAGVTVELRNPPVPETLPAAIGHAGYRIVQEALTNVLRHSTARHAVVSVCPTGNTLTIEVTNDGQARSRQTATPGHGLQGMAERAAALGGRCEAGVTPDGGWRVWASLPTTTSTAP